MDGPYGRGNWQGMGWFSKDKDKVACLVQRLLACRWLFYSGASPSIMVQGRRQVFTPCTSAESDEFPLAWLASCGEDSWITVQTGRGGRVPVGWTSSWSRWVGVRTFDLFFRGMGSWASSLPCLLRDFRRRLLLLYVTLHALCLLLTRDASSFTQATSLVAWADEIPQGKQQLRSRVSWRWLSWARSVYWLWMQVDCFLRLGMRCWGNEARCDNMA